MSSEFIRRNWLRISFVVALLAVSPLAFSQSQGVEENRACAADSCEPEAGSMCAGDDVILDDYYLSKTMD